MSDALVPNLAICLSICPRSVGAVFFSALSISMAIVVLHGAFREPDNLFIDEAEVGIDSGEMGLRQDGGRTSRG